MNYLNKLLLIITLFSYIPCIAMETDPFYYSEPSDPLTDFMKEFNGINLDTLPLLKLSNEQSSSNLNTKQPFIPGKENGGNFKKRKLNCLLKPKHSTKKHKSSNTQQYLPENYYTAICTTCNKWVKAHKESLLKIAMQKHENQCRSKQGEWNIYPPTHTHHRAHQAFPCKINCRICGELIWDTVPRNLLNKLLTHKKKCSGTPKKP